jgi:TRAP-type C4-dicarboxylate transport system substrate-binding protein
MKPSIIARPIGFLLLSLGLPFISSAPPTRMIRKLFTRRFTLLLRISTPAVPDDWHGKMWTVFKETLDKSAPGEFDVQINLNASLFKQGTEPAAMARGNLELSSISAFDIAKQVPEFRSSPPAT